ncbi:hypothetical protein C6496_12055 [Candidatus Poribacteria bacterium]|nr:MAG: hypothetical protein C6496_12055 [Candidatus Poribacteria bacterium]
MSASTGRPDARIICSTRSLPEEAFSESPPSLDLPIRDSFVGIIGSNGSTVGTSIGGSTTTGGSSTGGSTTTGGSSTGGSSIGGSTTTGGSSTGGSSTGGSSTGGSTTIGGSAPAFNINISSSPTVAGSFSNARTSASSKIARTS